MRIPTGGRLLDSVVYCMRRPCKALDIVGRRIEVRDTFPYNPDSRTAQETARRWAKGHSWEPGRYEPEVVVHDNAPFDITITDLHVRAEGGRAYKVVDDGMRRFDLREDQVLEVMRTVGISPMGRIPGKFAWGILGSQVRLVLVGGALHASMIAGAAGRKASDGARRSGSAPTEGSLRPGHVYRKRDGSLHLFLGRVRLPDSDAIHFAFVQMPVAAARAEGELEELEAQGADVAWLARQRKENEVYAQWDSMTWRQRCDHEWVERHMMRPRVRFMSSPKFEEDVGAVEPDLLDDIRENRSLKHDYVRGAGHHDLIAEHFLGPGQRWPYQPYPAYDAPRLTCAEVAARRAEWAKKQDEERARAHAAFRDALQWNPPTR